MMAEKMLENVVCQACGAAARRHSLFCYNCGTAVSPEVIAKTESYAGLTVGDALQREELKEDDASSSSGANAPRITNRLEESIPKPLNLPIEKTSVDSKKPVSQTENRLKSAAELRQQSKTAVKKSLEVSWEEPQNAPNIWFLIATFVLTLFAVGVLYAMLYIR